MSVWLVILLCVLWGVIGGVSLVLDWIRKWDFTLGDILLVLVGILLGPIMLLIILCDRVKDTVLVHKRAKH